MCLKPSHDIVAFENLVLYALWSLILSFVDYVEHESGSICDLHNDPDI